MPGTLLLYAEVEKQLRRVVKANGFKLGSHAANALRDDHFTAKDVMHCFSHGNIVSDQYDPEFDDVNNSIPLNVVRTAPSPACNCAMSRTCMTAS